MDVDAYTAAHGAEWRELDDLARRRHLDGAGADRLIDLYQSGAAQLSSLKSSAGATVVGERLSLSLSRARLRFTGQGRSVASQVPAFFAYQLPAAMYRIRWLTLVMAAVTAVVATLYGVWAASDPAVLATFGSAEFRKQFATQDFVKYYSESPPSSFTGQVWTNNAFLAAQSVAFGITGVYPAYLLLTNAQNIGIDAGILDSVGRLKYFFLYIAPHGQLELYSIFMAFAAGLMIFWSWIAPGGRSRVQALADTGRALITLAVGLTITLLMSGLIEGFVTRQPWPWAIKIGIGTVALAAVVVYQWVLGGRAWRAGQTGDLDEFEAGARQLVSG
ncbi:stage II sporulation protein M [Frondihabitans australicus]|uniref:Putative membrane protein SpoIIM required for sporulation n=1 Tax=Frondihabitans australicus TaxID=386892 RepID=A0A495IB84_9MICO|nr:stage II sporulation protein M [Frondihabitans australicus]RKR73267.1 putative membrane protein SpoIIM required for sporulation [Frondihabitans australicus]